MSSNDEGLLECRKTQTLSSEYMGPLYGLKTKALFFIFHVGVRGTTIKNIFFIVLVDY